MNKPLSFIELMFFIALYHASLKNYNISSPIEIDMQTWYYLMEQLSIHKISFSFLDGTKEYPCLYVTETEIIIDKIPQFLEKNSINFSPNQNDYQLVMSFMENFFSSF